MLKNENRLKKRKEFNFIYRHGTALHSANFTIHYVNTNRPIAKIGISVSKQVGNSVVRSRVKRIISEACRLNIGAFAVKNYVITAKIGLVGRSSKDVEVELLALLKKKNLLRAESVSL